MRTPRNAALGVAALLVLLPALAQGTAYSGHGAETVSPEILAKFAPTPLSSDLSRKIQSMMDLRAPGMGVLTPDGSRLFASYLFILEERDGELRCDDPREGITDWLEADLSDLDDAAMRLRACPEPWASWGQFRALVLDALVPAVGGAKTPSSTGAGSSTPGVDGEGSATAGDA